MFRRVSASALVVTVATLIACASASATTFCVPGYYAACPNSGGNVAQPDLQAAVETNGGDGVPDTVMVDAFTYVDTQTLEPDGTDPLKIIGAGTDKTVITSASNLNVYVMTQGFGDRPLTLKDLSIVAPASFPDSGGAGLFIQAGKLVNVNIESKNLGLQTALNASGATEYTGGRIFGSAGGLIGEAVRTYGSEPGQLTIDGVDIVGAQVGISLTDADQPVLFRNGRVLGTGAAASVQIFGGDLKFENSVVEAGSSVGFTMGSADSDVTHFDLVNSTVVAAGHPTVKAISGAVSNAASQDSIRVTVSDSIIRGFDSTYNLSAPNSSPLGDAYISFEHSNFNLLGTRTGDGSTYIPSSNINQDPLFNPSGDYSLLPGSPSIDAGDPFETDPATDINGVIRPLDGNGDGKAVRDQGAYEYNPTNPVNDTTAPTVSKVKFRKPTGKKGGSVSLTLSEAAKVQLTFKPTGKPKRKTFKLKKQSKAGKSVIKLKKGKLKAGKYRLSVTATDAAGNKSKSVVRKVKVGS